MKWHLPCLGRFFDANEDRVIYYDRASGDTHLITPFAAHLVQLLSEGPLSTRELVERASTAIDEDAAIEAPEAVNELLDELVSLDIVEAL